MKKKIPKEAVITFLKITRNAIDLYIDQNTPKMLKQKKAKTIRLNLIDERSKEK